MYKCINGPHHIVGSIYRITIIVRITPYFTPIILIYTYFLLIHLETSLASHISMTQVAPASNQPLNLRPLIVTNSWLSFPHLTHIDSWDLLNNNTSNYPAFFP
jgi:hypothetical protein